MLTTNGLDNNGLVQPLMDRGVWMLSQCRQGTARCITRCITPLRRASLSPITLRKEHHSLEQGGRDSIGGIALVHVVLQHQAAVELGLVLRVMLVSIVGVHCMAHVG